MKDFFRQYAHITRIIIAGLLLAVSQPNPLIPGNFGWHPPTILCWLSATMLFLPMLATKKRTAFLSVWAILFIYYLINLTWISLFGEGIYGIIIWLVLPLAISIYSSIAVFITVRARVDHRPIVFALAMAGIEWLREQGIFGFAWSQIGMGQVEGSFIKIASLGGINLITFITLWLCGEVVMYYHTRGKTRRMLITAAITTGALLSAAFIVTNRPSVADPIKVTVVQPSTAIGLTPADLVNPTTQAGYDKLIEREKVREENLRVLSMKAPIFSVKSMIVWSESSLGGPPYQSWINDICRQKNAWLLCGSPMIDNEGIYRNTAFLMNDANFLEVAKYDKIHLVPFGEFVPFRKFAEKHFQVRGNDIIPGKRRFVFDQTGHPFGVGICFESAQPDISRWYAKNGAKTLYFITNDAWFHTTPAIQQHFNQSRYRAIEIGLPVVRCASTGISGFISPNGDVIDQIPVNEKAILTAYINPGPANTPYTKFGWLFGPLALLASILLAVIYRERRALEE
jgi:apolipoprotein N-acyltransferase